MSHEDPYRPNQGRDRGAYTPPTDDDLPFNRQGYDPRRGGGGGGGGGGKAPPMTLIISAVVLLVLIIAVVVYYRAGPRASGDAPPAVGTPVGEMTSAAPIDAQPVDPTAGIDVYADSEAPGTVPTFTPPPEAVQPRPAPAPV
ncbi:MAG: SPOR domain-containing protein, partial [Alphaproteobacteria bacterium]|nr:SPOR domain-containing protein [Alphaproteobacteria bacterium]